MVTLTRVKVLKTKRKSTVTLTRVKVLKTKRKSTVTLTRKSRQALILGDKSVPVPNTRLSALMSIQVKTAANTRVNARIDTGEIDVSYTYSCSSWFFSRGTHLTAAFVLIGCFCRNKGT
jgi:hypothetical protein